MTPASRTLSNIACLLNVGSSVSDRRCSCGRVQSVDFLSPDDAQNVDSTECSGNNCIVELAQTVLLSKSDIKECLQHLSLDVKACVHNLPHCGTKYQLPDIVLKVIDVMVKTNQAILRVINGFVQKYLLDHIHFEELADLGKFALSSLGDLAQHVEKICTDTYIETLTDVGIMRGHLEKRGLRKYAITLLSPLWPSSETDELMSYITPEEALCQLYLIAGKIEAALYVVSRVIMTGIRQVSEPIVRVLSRLLVKHESLFSNPRNITQLSISMTILRLEPMFHDIVAQGCLLCFEAIATTFATIEVEIDTLMSRAMHCLEVWTNWFHSVGSELFNEEGHSRINLSFRFLRKIAELAIANFQNVTAIKALCEALDLAYMMNQEDAVRDVTQLLITLMPQLGLQITDYDDPENKDVFMDSMGLGRDSGLLSLVAIATYHLKTGQLQKFLQVRDAIYTETCHNKLVTDFSQAIIKRLEAEFIMLPSSRLLDGENDSTKPLQYALCLAASSFVSMYKIIQWIGRQVP